MNNQPIRTALLAVTLAAVPVLASAQFPPPPPPPGSPPPASQPPASSSPTVFPPPPGAPPVRDRWPDPAKPAEAPRSQTQPAAPARQRPATQAQPAPGADPAAAPASRRAPRVAAPATVVACDGVFVKDSSHLKLAMKYDSRNIVYADIRDAAGKTIKASVLYPNDPRRRLEVVWMNEAARTQLLVIAINGQSQWSAPKGLKLGLPVAALEKMNGRPFKVSGFGSDGLASVLGWDGGALTSLPGGCKLGVQLRLDQRAPDAARTAVSEAKELMSNDAALQPVKPTVAEILIGY
jgi:hypothetical protein